MKYQQLREQNSQLQNYFALLAIVPAVISIMAYEFLDYLLFIIRPWRTDYDPVTGLGILIPMALMMESVTFFFSKHLLQKVRSGMINVNAMHFIMQSPGRAGFDWSQVTSSTHMTGTPLSAAYDLTFDLDGVAPSSGPYNRWYGRSLRELISNRIEPCKMYIAWCNPLSLYHR